MFGNVMKKAQEAMDKAMGKTAGADKEEKKEEPEAAAEDPNLLSAKDASDAASALRAAMKGVGTDEDELIKVLGPLTPEQAAQVREVYKEQEKRDLVEDLKSELGGKFEDLLVALVTSKAEFHAQQVRAACKGLGTDEELLIESICLLDDEEMKAAAKSYRVQFERLMDEDVRDELKGKFKKLLTTVIAAALKGRADSSDDIDELVLRLYKAGEGKMGTDEQVFIDILGTHTRRFIIEELAPAYAKKHGNSLAKAVRKELGGDLELAFLTLILPRHEILSDRIHKAMKGAGSDTDTIVRIVAAARGPLLREVNAHFLAKHEKSLARWIEGEESGDLKKALVTVVKAYE